MGSTEALGTGVEAAGEPEDGRTAAEQARRARQAPPVERAEPTVRGPRRFLLQDLGQTDFGLRRFKLRPQEARSGLEEAGRSFLSGFNALISRRTETIEDFREDLRGFAFEGAGMAAAVLDLVTLTGGRHVRELLNGPAARYPHLVHVGIGWGYARMRARPMWGIKTAHPLLRWLAHDGYGFHQGFFATDATVGAQRRPRTMSRAHRALVDQGLGRMLWFHECAGPDDVAARIAEFPPGRRADLWSGVGLASTYAGQCDAEGLAALAAHAAADGCRAHLAQGGVFACSARIRSGIVPPHTAEAAPVLCGVEVDEAASWADESLAALGESPASHDDYQAWRAGIRRAWARGDKTRPDV
ncbi:Protein of unknown function [Sinosporangium album]|uniref:DUF1702 family protein n=1 Tax=Sinosporangium album TaxID=504805 RepID=A0A1G8F2X3_9ACTN|nr:DUF1702 family protein [Sinosporangium album]SDH76448.1 Protein of unknown function [Sinosporangium album]